MLLVFLQAAQPSQQHPYSKAHISMTNLA